MKKIFFEEKYKDKNDNLQTRLVVRVFNANDPINLSDNLVLCDDNQQAMPNEYFRNAWRLDKKTKKITINKEKAIDIHVDNLRVERDKKLKELDVETTKATQKQDKDALAKLDKQAQKLRDMPELARKELLSMEDDFEAIKNYKPDYL